MASTATSQKDIRGHYKESTGGGSGYGGHKQGPREIGRAHGQLASQQAGIKAMTAQQAQQMAQEGSFQPHYDTKGLTTTALSEKDLRGHFAPGRGRDIFGGTSGGRKQGPREIGRASGQLASEAAGIKAMTAHNTNLFQAHHDTRGFSAMH